MQSHEPLRGVLSVWCILILIAAILAAGCSELSGTSTGRLHEAENSGDLRVYFLDVEQGDSALILFHDTVILIDAGEAEQGKRVVNDLKKLGVDHIDLLVATHPHSDHIGGMQDVIAAFPVDTLLDTGLPYTSPLYEHLLQTVDRQDIRYLLAEQGRTIDLDPSLSLLVLSPPKERADDNLNANSIVLKISYGTISFLFTGDADRGAENALALSGYSPAVQVLKVAHHGSSDATSAAFLSRIRPEVSVISLGADNPYGYPHRETLDALQAVVPAIYRTDRDGTVLIRSNGTSYSVTTENGRGGVWANPYLPSPAVSPGMTAATQPIPSSATVPAVTAPAVPAVPHTITVPIIPDIPSNLTIPIPSLPIPPVRIGNDSLVKIESVQFNAPGDDRENLNGEWVRITNRGEGAVLISGWTLTDLSGSDPYIFPAFLLLPDASVTVYTGSGAMNDTALFMERSDPIWGNSGDTAFLRDAGGNLIDRRSGGGSP